MCDGKNSKGQSFIIIALVTILILVMLKTSLNLVRIMENKRYLEAGLERLQFNNIRNELLNSMQPSVANGNVTKTVNEFLKFARSVLFSRGIELKGIFVEATYPTLHASTDTRLNVTVLNMLDYDITSLNMDLNGTVVNSSIEHMHTVQVNFTINTANDVNYILTVQYTTPQETKTESITIPAKIGKSKFIGFFYLELESDRLKQYDKIEKVVDL